ncbi:beta-1,3-galactosyltransferase 2-like [Anguilla anguilla]|uniref:beta-1,3-galactosyltransferase 2-like n=1 Tax=Anguilla anguilla TaxID=7936 RepID=UPI0015AD5980|nr:beta-1,3-galactosyltransferase 2-like [Anguilla anguilla]
MFNHSSRTLIKCCVLSLSLVALSTFIVSFFLIQRQRGTTDQSPHPIAQEYYKFISPSTYRYVLNQPEKCRGKKPFLVLMVPVAPGDRSSRDAIRATWGQEGLIPDVVVTRIFFVGLATGEQGPRVQKELERESQEHGDIVQMNFLDSYRNLTIKTMMMMNWLASSCQGASYAMKIDADIFLNVRYLVDHFLGPPTSAPVRQGYITGSVISDGRPRRDKKSKWYVSEEVYPEPSYPPYVSGAGYVFSTDLAARISWASRFVRPFPMEDVYVGLCLRVLGVRPAYSYSLPYMRNLFEIRRLEYDRCLFSRLVIATGFKPRELLRIWHDFQKSSFTC